MQRFTRFAAYIFLGCSIFSPAVFASSTHAADWPGDWEKQFQQRRATILKRFAETNTGKYGNTFFENEKRSYPAAMFDILNGNVAPAVKFLQEEDNLRADNAHTLGIDLYPCFTLKGQVRKYFYFGEYLDREYRDRMTQAAKTWTEQDPHRRPHPLFGTGDGKDGWRPQQRGGWVDVRSTDNLKAMRETSVYLFAEATGNEKTRQIYKERIGLHVASLYHVGMSEWDSENYFGHSVAPYLSLYDFAKDPEVKATAKAALDWFATAGALKYHRGGWGGPTKRDYGGANVVFGSGASMTFWPWFGETPFDLDDIEPDLIHVITSTYRPPAAAVAIARRQLDRPVTLVGTKPPYATFSPDAIDAPQYWETLHLGRTFTLGSCVSREPAGDVGPMKLLADNSKRGVDYVVVNTADAAEQVEMAGPGKRSGDQIIQHRHILTWMRKDDRPGTQFVFQLPKTATTERVGDRWIIKLEKTCVGVIPIGLDSPKSAEITGKRAERYADETLLIARSKAAGYVGFGMIVGDDASHGDSSRFRRAVGDAKLVVDRLDQGIVELHDEAGGAWLRSFYNGGEGNDRAGLVRGGKGLPDGGEPIDWDEHKDIYAIVPGMDGSVDGPVTLGWKEGTLRVRAGKYGFETTVSPEGKVKR